MLFHNICISILHLAVCNTILLHNVMDRQRWLTAFNHKTMVRQTSASASRLGSPHLMTQRPACRVHHSRIREECTTWPTSPVIVFRGGPGGRRPCLYRRAYQRCISSWCYCRQQWSFNCDSRTSGVAQACRKSQVILLAQSASRSPYPGPGRPCLHLSCQRPPVEAIIQEYLLPFRRYYSTYEARYTFVAVRAA